MTSNNTSIGVIFDMDGVLIDSAKPHFQSWVALATECGGTVTQSQFAETFGRQNNDIIPILFGEVSPNRMGELADRKEEIYRELIRQSPPLVSGAATLVSRLSEAGIALAVGSSGPRKNIDQVLEALGVPDCFSAIVSGDDVTRGKPDPQVFLMAAERLGIDPGHCVIIEDAPVGIQAGKAAGGRTVAVSLYHPPTAFDGADLIVDRLADLSVMTVSSLVNGG